jgi:glycolate oxidase FAD binding subunit
MPAFRPADPTEAAAIIAEAAHRRTPLAVMGLGSKRHLGRPAETQNILDLSNLSGISFYEPEDLVLSALAGTPIELIEAQLAKHGQELAFEPMSLAPLYSTGAGTIGGAYMTNLSGPRRIKAGAARDFVLGVKAISGRGDMFKAGGRVVKNVTGYDLARGLAGSFGTLAVATEITLKVLPRAETAATLLIPGLDPANAAAALCAAMGTPADVSGAAHLPAAAARRQGFAIATTALRIEGFAPSVAARCDMLAAILEPFGRSERLDAKSSAILWRAIRDIEPLAKPRENVIWKISVAPTAGPRIVEAIAATHDCDVLYDWACGLVWLSLAPCDDAGAGAIRKAIGQNGGGQATLIRAPEKTRKIIPVFEPQLEPLAALSRRLKAQFDPFAILEPGRLWPGA